MTDSEYSGHRGFGAETVNNWVQTLAIIGAGLSAIDTFGYPAKIVPNLAPPTRAVTSPLDQVGVTGDQIAARSTVTRSNVGRTGVGRSGLMYNAIGVNLQFAGANEAVRMLSTISRDRAR